MTRRNWFLVIAAFCILLSACSTSGGPAELASADPSFEDDDLDKINNDIQQGIARGIASCMAVAAFEYAAFVPDEPTGPRVESASTEVISRDGYGIATFWLERAKARADNPNLDIVAALAPAEFEEYTVALHGNQATDHTGCQQKALDEVFEDPTLTVLGLVTDQIDEGIERIDSSIEVANAIAAWTTCMNEAGYGVLGPGDAENRITNEVSGLSQRLAITLDPSAGLTAIRGMTVADLPDDLQEDLDNLIIEEQKVAVQDYSCYREHVESVRRPLIDALELEAVNANRGDLEQAGYLS